MQDLGKVRPAIGERIEPGAKNHILGNPTLDRLVNLALKIAAASDNRSRNGPAKRHSEAGIRSPRKFGL